MKKIYNQGFLKIFGTNGSTCCFALIMVHSLLTFCIPPHSPAPSFFFPPLLHLITYSPSHALWNECLSCKFPSDLLNDCQKQRLQLCFNQGKLFVLGTTCVAVALPPFHPLACPSVVSSELAAGLLLLRDLSPCETWSLNVPFHRLHFHPGLLCLR